MRLSLKSLRLILYLWGHAFSSRKQTLHTGIVKLGQGDFCTTARQWFPPGCGAKILWQQGGGKAPNRVQTQASLMKDNGCAFAKHSEAFGAGQHWDPHAQMQLDPKGSSAANPESCLAVTRCVRGYTRV